MATTMFAQKQPNKKYWSLYILLSLATRVFGATINYCSSQNTGSAFSPVYNQFQSNGACHDTCSGQYAIAIIAGSQCWCSNYAPANTIAITNCQVECPGYMEWCGNAAQGYYAYFLLDGKVASGTVGPSSSTSSPVSTIPLNSGSPTSSSRASTPTSTSGSSSLTVPTAQQSTGSSTTAVLSSASVVTSQNTNSNTATSSTDTSRSSSSDSSSSAPTQVLTSITTVTGQARTILITPTSTADSSLGSTGSSGGGGGVGTGTVVGIVVGVALAIGLAIGLVVWYYWRRKHQRAIDNASIGGASVNGGGNNNGIPSRQVSQMSSAGLLGRPPRINTAGIAPSSGPKSANSNRHSLGTDQRLNPYAIYAQEEARHSNVSLQDNQDYSRQLRVANPDN